MADRNTFRIVVVTPQGVMYDQQVAEATFQTRDGEITVLADHTPLVSVLEVGEMRVRVGEEEHAFVVLGGLLEIREHGKVVILTNESECAEDIDIEEAEAARKRAEEALQEKEKLDKKDLARFESQLMRELMRLRVGGRK